MANTAEVSEVYHSNEMNNKFLSKLKEELRLNFAGCRRIAVKIHFGEPGNKFSFNPDDVKPITSLLKDMGFDFFLYDSSVTYGGPRANPLTHKKMAAEKGWDKLGKIITDDDFVKAQGVNMKYEICRPLVDADAVLVISHFKGHFCSGFGGAIKNLGMGALSQKSKNAIHDGGMPIFEGDCIQCKACEIACPLGYLKVTSKPEINECIGCSNCIYSCPLSLFKPKLNYFDTLLADGAATAQKSFKKVYFVSFLTKIAKICDCSLKSNEIVAKDKGFLLSKDAVAIDKASYNLVTDSGKNDVFLKHNKKSGTQQVIEAEKYSMGSSEYKLNEIK